MCNYPKTPHGAQPVEKIKTGEMGVNLANLPAVGQRQLKLPGARQFDSIVGVPIGPPKDITRQA